jgi:hypothetical protein
MMASLLPGGDAEFPDSTAMMASLLPGGDAEFPDLYCNALGNRTTTLGRIRVCAVGESFRRSHLSRI